MKRIALLLCAASAVIISGCGLLPIVRGSGYLASSSFDLGSYSKIAASQTCKVHVVPDTVTSLEVICDDNIVDYLEIRTTGADSVTIGLRQGFNYVDVTFTAEVHAPVLSGLDLSGAAEARVDPGFASGLPLSITLSGASSAEVNALTCGAMTADLSGASSLTISGSAASESLVLSGASDAHLLDLSAHQASVALSGSSDCWLDVGAGPVDLSASGASTLYIRGTPSLRVESLSGSSRIVKL